MNAVLGLLIVMLVGVFVVIADHVTGMGAKRLYIVGPAPEVIGEQCERRIDCRRGVASMAGYDEVNHLVTCACPDGNIFRFSALVYTSAGYQ